MRIFRTAIFAVAMLACSLPSMAADPATPTVDMQPAPEVHLLDITMPSLDTGALTIAVPNKAVSNVDLPSILASIAVDAQLQHARAARAAPAVDLTMPIAEILLNQTEHGSASRSLQLSPSAKAYTPAKSERRPKYSST
jgi:hypothetical protein